MASSPPSGVFVNRGAGQAYVGAYVTVDDGKRLCFQMTQPDEGIVATDRASARDGVGFLHWEWSSARVGRLTLDERRCRIDIEFVDFYEPAHWGANDVFGAAGHVEASGRVRGVIEIDGVRRELDMLAHRDQSWGPRARTGEKPCVVGRPLQCMVAAVDPGAVQPLMNMVAKRSPTVNAGQAAAGAVTLEAAMLERLSEVSRTALDFDRFLWDPGFRGPAPASCPHRVGGRIHTVSTPYSTVSDTSPTTGRARPSSNDSVEPVRLRVRILCVRLHGLCGHWQSF